MSDIDDLRRAAKWLRRQHLGGWADDLDEFITDHANLVAAVDPLIAAHTEARREIEQLNAEVDDLRRALGRPSYS